MEIEALKEAIGDERFLELETYITDLTNQRDQARNESISGRKGLKEKVATLEDSNSVLMEKLGVESLDELDELPDAKGAAEAAKQYETRLKRLERQLADANESNQTLNTKYRETLQHGIVSDAIGGYDFVARDVVSSYIGQRLTWEGDDLLFRTDDGHVVSVKDGVAGLAKSRPELLKPQGTGGAGVRSTNAGGEAGQTVMTRAEFEALTPQKKMEIAQKGVELH